MTGIRESTIAVRVYYEDTDAGGIVYHANHLKYAERGRTEFLRELGVEQNQLRRETGLGFAVAKLAIDYLAPAVLDDDLRVRTVVTAARRVSFDFLQTIERAGEILARMDVRVACIDARGRPARLPRDLADAANAAHNAP